MATRNITMSLDAARVELRRRFHDEALKTRVREVLGEKFIPYFESEKPIAVTLRQLVSADNGLAFFYQCANYLGARPTVMEYLDDKFVSLNEEKKGLGKLRITTPNKEKVTVDIINFHAQENKRLRDLVTLSGDSLVNFHHKLIEIEGNDIDIHDTSVWLKSIGNASKYYYYKLLHYIAHGVLVECFYDEGGTREDTFTHNVVYPAIDRIHTEFGLMPMIVRAYPEEQTDEEDFYWWDHSRIVNDYIIEYARAHNLPTHPA